MTNREKELITENQKLRAEIQKLQEKIECYRRLEVELSTEIDLLREGIVK